MVKNMVRLDKWLWAARMYKTRSMASDACTGGHVEVNSEPAKPSVNACPTPSPAVALRA